MAKWVQVMSVSDNIYWLNFDELLLVRLIYTEDVETCTLRITTKDPLTVSFEVTIFSDDVDYIANQLGIE